MRVVDSRELSSEENVLAHKVVCVDETKEPLLNALLQVKLGVECLGHEVSFRHFAILSETVPHNRHFALQVAQMTPGT